MPKYSDYREYESYRDSVNEDNMNKYLSGVKTYQSDLPISYSEWVSINKNAVVKGELKYEWPRN